MNEDPTRQTPAGAEASPSEPFSTHEEPVTTGTVVLMGLFLVMIFGVWIVMYLTLLGR